MSKHKSLFQSVHPQTHNNVHVPTAQESSYTISEDHELLKKDLKNVGLIIFAIIIIFSALHYSNIKHPWITNASERITKILIRNY